MDDKQDTHTNTSPEHLEKAIEVITENQTTFEQLAHSDLPIAEDAERALSLLNGDEEDE